MMTYCSRPRISESRLQQGQHRRHLVLDLPSGERGAGVRPLGGQHHLGPREHGQHSRADGVDARSQRREHHPRDS